MVWRALVKMIEFFTRKRMAIAILILTIVSVVVLVIETNFRSHEMKPEPTDNLNSSSDCAGEYEITDPCKPCNQFEMKMQNYCLATGFKETIKCKTSPNKEFPRRCPKQSWIEERKFWIFELVATAVGISSYAAVFLREKRLDRLLMDKVNKQIAAGI